MTLLGEAKEVIQHKEEIIQQLSKKLEGQALTIKKLEVSRATLKARNKELMKRIGFDWQCEICGSYNDQDTPFCMCQHAGNTP